MDPIADTQLSYIVYMDIHEGKLAEFKKYASVLMGQIPRYDGMHFYTFSYNAEQTKAIVREGYKTGQAVVDRINEVTPDLMNLFTGCI